MKGRDDTKAGDNWRLIVLYCVPPIVKAMIVHKLEHIVFHTLQQERIRVHSPVVVVLLSYVVPEELKGQALRKRLVRI